MRMTLAIVMLLALAARAQDARVWRAYDIGASPVYRHGPDNEDRPEPPFGLLGLAPPSKTQHNERLWETGDNEPDGLAQIAPGILKSLIPGINILGARDSLLIEGSTADHRLVARTINLIRAQTLIAVEVRHLSLPRDLDAAGRRLIADALAGNIDAATLAALRKLDPSGGCACRCAVLASQLTRHQILSLAFEQALEPRFDHIVKKLDSSCKFLP